MSSDDEILMEFGRGRRRAIDVRRVSVGDAEVAGGSSGSEDSGEEEVPERVMEEMRAHVRREMREAMEEGLLEREPRRHDEEVVWERLMRERMLAREEMHIMRRQRRDALALPGAMLEDAHLPEIGRIRPLPGEPRAHPEEEALVDFVQRVGDQMRVGYQHRTRRRGGREPDGGRTLESVLRPTFRPARIRREVKLRPASSYVSCLDTRDGEKIPTREEQLELQEQLERFEKEWQERDESALDIKGEPLFCQRWYTKETARKIVNSCLENLGKYFEDRSKHDRIGKRRARKIREQHEDSEERRKRIQKEDKAKELRRARRAEHAQKKRERKEERDRRNRVEWQQREEARIKGAKERRSRYEAELESLRWADLLQRRELVEGAWNQVEYPPMALPPALLDDAALPLLEPEPQEEPFPESEEESDDDFYDLKEEKIPESSSSGEETLTDEEDMSLGFPGYCSVACLCCPSIMEAFLETEQVRMGEVRVTLFDADERFAEKFPDSFVKFDVLEGNIDEYFAGKFQFVIADVPNPTNECFSKIRDTMCFLSNPLPRFQFLLTGMVLNDTTLKPVRSMKVNHVIAPGDSDLPQYICYSNFLNDEGINHLPCHPPNVY